MLLFSTASGVMLFFGIADFFFGLEFSFEGDLMKKSLSLEVDLVFS